MVPFSDWTLRGHLTLTKVSTTLGTEKTRPLRQAWSKSSYAIPGGLSLRPAWTMHWQASPRCARLCVKCCTYVMSASSHSPGEPIKFNDLSDIPQPLAGPDRVESSCSYLASVLSTPGEKPVWLSFGKCWHLFLSQAVIISQGIPSIQSRHDQQLPSIRVQ